MYPKNAVPGHASLWPVELGNVIPHVLIFPLYDSMILVDFWGPKKLGTAGSRPTFHFTGATDDLRSLGRTRTFEKAADDPFQQSVRGKWVSAKRQTKRAPSKSNVPLSLTPLARSF